MSGREGGREGGRERERERERDAEEWWRKGRVWYEDVDTAYVINQSINVT